MVELNQIMELTGEWICEIKGQMVGDAYDGDWGTYQGEWEEIGWDDVKNVCLPGDLVRKGRKEDVDFMEKRNISWGICNTAEGWRKTGSAPVAVRC